MNRDRHDSGKFEKVKDLVAAAKAIKVRGASWFSVCATRLLQLLTRFTFNTARTYCEQGNTKVIRECTPAGFILNLIDN